MVTKRLSTSMEKHLYPGWRCRWAYRCSGICPRPAISEMPSVSIIVRIRGALQHTSTRPRTLSLPRFKSSHTCLAPMRTFRLLHLKIQIMGIVAVIATSLSMTLPFLLSSFAEIPLCTGRATAGISCTPCCVSAHTLPGTYFQDSFGPRNADIR
ncbi:uncharacterized protein HD556DRAFT_1321020 [Suillus plorans]|uniref:Uncharacterized protein n=1 Tax=Suillus plorans TaxID=116603 RepID=A0A9P7DY64_9AGAM|nr:uncharacterized protein HD556DRAFT_1321020 [Suillus plorans]KAG1806295.1 hypothetical protein HD556DRAFT_1321020 [Suillus plorans]KAG1830352.1 hypothetical protein EV424DRAFT_1376257 [Suillus variegatus]